MTRGLSLIEAERLEQIEKHGFSLENDQYYSNCQLLQAAEFCLEQAAISSAAISEYCKWPDGWDPYFEKKIRSKTRIEKLTVAGAFLLAEGDRIKRKSFFAPLVQSIARDIDSLIYIENKKIHPQPAIRII